MKWTYTDLKRNSRFLVYCKNVFLFYCEIYDHFPIVKQTSYFLQYNLIFYYLHWHIYKKNFSRTLSSISNDNRTPRLCTKLPPALRKFRYQNAFKLRSKLEQSNRRKLADRPCPTANVSITFAHVLRIRNVQKRDPINGKIVPWNRPVHVRYRRFLVCLRTSFISATWPSLMYEKWEFSYWFSSIRCLLLDKSVNLVKNNERCRKCFVSEDALVCKICFRKTHWKY